MAASVGRRVSIAVFTLLGLALSGLGVTIGIRNARLALTAPRIVSYVVSNETEECKETTGSGDTEREVSYLCYAAVVRYEVGGAEYTATLPTRAREPADPGEVRALWVDPADPHSVLEVAASSFVAPAVVLFFGVAVLGALWLVTREQPPERSAR